jgi:hypothetical protein
MIQIKLGDKVKILSDALMRMDGKISVPCTKHYTHITSAVGCIGTVTEIDLEEDLYCVENLPQSCYLKDKELQHWFYNSNQIELC